MSPASRPRGHQPARADGHGRRRPSRRARSRRRPAPRPGGQGGCVIGLGVYAFLACLPMLLLLLAAGVLLEALTLLAQLTCPIVAALGGLALWRRASRGRPVGRLDVVALAGVAAGVLWALSGLLRLLTLDMWSGVVLAAAPVAAWTVWKTVTPAGLAARWPGERRNEAKLSAPSPTEPTVGRDASDRDQTAPRSLAGDS